MALSSNTVVRRKKENGLSAVGGYKSVRVGYRGRGAPPPPIGVEDTTQVRVPVFDVLERSTLLPSTEKVTLGEEERVLLDGIDTHCVEGVNPVSEGSTVLVLQGV